MSARTMKGKKADQRLIEILRSWRTTETYTIKGCEKLLARSDNQLVKTIISAIRSDSEKHRDILQLILDSMTKQAIHLTPEEIADIASSIDRHISIEEKTIGYTEKAIGKATDPVMKQLLRYILDDEKKHERMLTQLSELKIRTLAKIP
jgi:rubrerythrin